MMQGSRAGVSALFVGLSLLLALVLIGCRSTGLGGRAGLADSSDDGESVVADASGKHDGTDGNARTAGTDVKQVSATSHARVVTFTDQESLQYDTGATDRDIPPKFEITESGLRYRILRASKGRHPTAADTVTVHYRGWLDNGKVFDSSYENGAPISFPLRGVVAGWTEGMQLVGEGGMIELWVPARLGYGAQGSGGSVPPNATLHFVVELLKVR